MKIKVIQMFLIVIFLFSLVSCLESGNNTHNVHEHEWDEGQIIKIATCKDDGSILYKCLTCSETKVDAIEAVGHSEVKDPSITVRCTTDGLTEGSHCSVCDEVLIPQYPIPALGTHKYNDDYECEVCGFVYYTDGLLFEEVSFGYHVYGYEGTDNTVIIPWKYNNKPVRGIKANAFSGKENVKSIIIPKTVTSIGASAFAETGLTSITFPTSLKVISDKILYGCKDLTSVTLPNNSISIGHYAFYSCSKLTSITLPDTLQGIGTFAFCRSGIKEIILPASVAGIGDFAFSECSDLKSINIPYGITTIGSYTFYDSGIESITLPNTIISIGEYAFASTPLKYLVIPSSVLTIDNYVFIDCYSIQENYTPLTDLVIYCEAEEQPVGWESKWDVFYHGYSDSCRLPVYWYGQWNYDTNGMPVVLE